MLLIEKSRAYNLTNIVHVEIAQVLYYKYESK